MSKVNGTYDENLVEQAKRIHEECIVIDSLGWGPNVYSKSMMQGIDRLLAEGSTANRIWDELSRLRCLDLVRDAAYLSAYAAEAKTAGVAAMSCTLSAFGERPWSFESAVREVGYVTYLFDALPQTFMKVTKADDIRRAKVEQKFGIVMNFQNTEYLGREIRNLELFHNYGIRIVQLTYNIRNLVGNGCTERVDEGLSSYGLEVVGKMNEQHMLIDLSHCGYKTAADAIEYSKDPVAFTHTVAKGVYNHVRGKTDDQLQAIAEKGGYIGLCHVPHFLTGKQNVTIDDFLKHIEHVVDLVGIDHVGIGTDWPLIPYGPGPQRRFADAFNKEMTPMGFTKEWRSDWNGYTAGLENWSNWPRITAALLDRGYSDNEAKKIIGGNFLRVFEDVVG